MSNFSNLSDWKNVKLHEVSTTKAGVLTSKSAIIGNEGTIPFIKAKDLHFDTIYYSNEKVTKEAVNGCGLEIVPKESLLIAISGPTVGSMAILENDAVVDNRIYYTVINVQLLNPRYLFFYLCFKRAQIVKSSRYIDRVSFIFLSKLDIPVPPLRIQVEVASELEKKLKSADLLIRKHKEKIDELNKQKQEALEQVFKNYTISVSDKIFDDARQYVRLKDCGFVQAGKTPNSSIKQYFGDVYPLFNTSDLEQGMNVVRSKTYLSYRGIKEARPVRENSILVCYHGIQFGKAAISRIMGACSSQLISIAPSEKILPEYLYFQIVSPAFQTQLRSVSTDLSISKAYFENLYIELPPLEMQRKVVDGLNKLSNELVEKSFNIARKLQEAELLRNSVLINAFEPSMQTKRPSL